MRRSALFGVGILVAAAQVSDSESAVACSPDLPGYGFQVPWWLPSDGVLLIECSISTCLSLVQASYTVFAADKSVLSGSLEEVPGSPDLLVWRPVEPIAPGTYTIEGTHPSFPAASTQTFQVHDRLDVPLNPHTWKPSSWSEWTGTRVCCKAGGELCGSGPACDLVVDGTASRVLFDIDFGPPDKTKAQAYIYRARAKGTKWPSFTASPNLSVLFEREASEYCYQLQVQDVRVGGELIEEENCVTAAEVPPVDSYNLDDAPSDLFAMCTTPPDGYETQWCRTYASNIATRSCVGAWEEPCEAALLACPPANGQTTNDSSHDPSQSDEAGAVFAHERTKGVAGTSSTCSFKTPLSSPKPIGVLTLIGLACSVTGRARRWRRPA